jgi:hypothetical protein
MTFSNFFHKLVPSRKNQQSYFEIVGAIVNFLFIGCSSGYIRYESIFQPYDHCLEWIHSLSVEISYSQ